MHIKPKLIAVIVSFILSLQPSVSLANDLSIENAANNLGQLYSYQKDGFDRSADISYILNQYPHIRSTKIEEDPNSSICYLIVRTFSFDEVLRNFTDSREFFNAVKNGDCYFITDTDQQNETLYVGPVNALSIILRFRPLWVPEVGRKLIKNNGINSTFELFSDLVAAGERYIETPFETAYAKLNEPREFSGSINDPERFYKSVRHGTSILCKAMQRKQKGQPFKKGFLNNDSELLDGSLRDTYNEFCITKLLGGKLVDRAEVFGPLWKAVEDEDFRLANKLIDSGVNVNLPENTSASGGVDTPLILAIRAEQFDLAHKMITLGADVRKQGLRDQTALMVAIEKSNSSKLVSTLLKAGSDPNQASGIDFDDILKTISLTGWQKLKPLQAAILKRNYPMMEELWGKTNIDDAEIMQMLTETFINPPIDRRLVEYVIGKGIDINETGSTRVLLSHIVPKSAIHDVQYIISMGAEVNEIDMFYGTILYQLYNDSPYFSFTPPSEMDEKIRFFESIGAISEGPTTTVEEFFKSYE